MEYSLKRAFRQLEQQPIELSKMNVQPVRILDFSHRDAIRFVSIGSENRQHSFKTGIIFTRHFYAIHNRTCINSQKKNTEQQKRASFQPTRTKPNEI